MTFLIWTMVAFGGDACETISLSDIAAVPEPAIIVLGERRGAQPDLARARRVLSRLQRDADGGVMLATDLVHHKYQKHLNAYTSGQTDLSTLEESLEWSNHSATSFTPYGQLFRLAEKGLQLRAVGTEWIGPPENVHPPVPGVYPSLVSSAVPEDNLPFGLDSRIAETMAYWDYQVAMRAVNEWDGRGYLVILTDRARTEGGGGVPWQLAQSDTHQVYAFLLAWAEPYCEEGDNVWAKVPLLYNLGL